MVESPRTVSRYRGGGGMSSTAPSVPPPPPVTVTLQYYGSHLGLSQRWVDPRDEVIIEQQPSGSNTLCVFRDRISPGSELTRCYHAGSETF